MSEPPDFSSRRRDMPIAADPLSFTLTRCTQDRAENAGIGAAPAQVAGQRALHLIDRRPRRLEQQRARGHDHAVVQYPHWAACSAMNAAWSGSGFCGVPSASIVVMCLPAMLLVGVMQDRVGWLSTSTVQVPHCPRPQPGFVPVRPTVLRIA